ncbi:MAG: GntR family transcriptional regulator [Phycisphaerae bacterium]|nr:GntR family transcriptional regulator [Phycisphaerae bacterium]
MILSGQAKPSAKLRQRHLAEKFGVSQAVVREALLELEAFGLTETIDNRGVFVTQINTEKLMESYEVRAVLEGLAAKLCCLTAPRGEIQKLTSVAEEICTAAQAGQLREAGLLDRKLHEDLMRLAGNGMLSRLNEHCKLLHKVLQGTRDFRVVRNEHLAVLRAIEEGQADLAERRMKEHIISGKRYFQNLIAKGEFVPFWVKEHVESKS